MSVKCEYKICENTILLSAPQGLNILPGRMIRMMIANIETKYQVYEYSEVRGMKNAEAMEDVVGIAPLSGAVPGWLSGGQKLVVFQKPHPSLYNANFIKLTDEEVESFREALPPGEEFIEADYTVSMPPDFFMLVTKDIRKFIDVITHLKLSSFPAVREAAARLGVAAITIYDEADMMVEINEPGFRELLLTDVDRLLGPPQTVDSLDI
ncbi:MAG: hypothetical protein ACOX7W_04860 [Christensenellales bacterium]|mgnify:CR=1 FL=1|jgi:hypothetical protein